jgi:sulfate permease, SulP family
LGGLAAAGSANYLIGGRRLARAAPWALIVLVVTTLINVIAGLERYGIKVLGTVDAGPPSLTWPAIVLAAWAALILRLSP